MEDQRFVEARNYEQRILPSLSTLYNTGLQEYTTNKYMHLSKEYFIPATLISNSTTKCGILPAINAVWAAQGSRLFLWRYIHNTIEQVLRFNSDICFVREFVPLSGIFKDEIEHCLIVLTETQAIIYGLKGCEILSTGLIAPTPDCPVCVDISNGLIFMGCKDGNMYQIVYRDSFFSSIFIYNPNFSYISYFLPAMLKKENLCIKAIKAGFFYAVALTNNNIRIYRIKKGKAEQSYDTNASDYIAINIISETEEELFFYVIRRDGSRSFFVYETQSCKHLFDKAAPQTSEGIFKTEFIGEKTFQALIKSPEQYEGSSVTILSLNENALVNFQQNKRIENYEMFVVNENIINTSIHKNLFFLTGSRLLEYEFLTKEKYLLISRPDDVSRFIKDYGDKEAFISYLMLISNGEDVSKLDHFFKKMEIKTEAIYCFLYRIIGPVLKKEINSQMALNKLSILKRRMENVKKYLFDNSMIDHLCEAINYISILYAHELYYTMDDILHPNTILSKLIDAYTLHNTSIEPLLNKMSKECPSFLPLDEVYYRKGKESLKNKFYKESLNSFKNVTKEDLEPIINEYNLNRFYYGSITLLRNSFYDDYEYFVGELVNALKCKCALDCALEDHRESFAFVVFEAMLILLKKGDGRMFGYSCVCSAYNEKKNIGETFLNIQINDIFRVNSPFLEAYLNDKSKHSNIEEEYELAWKYYLFKKDKIRSADSLYKLATNKHIEFKKRIEYLTLAAGLVESYKLKLELAKIQEDIIYKTKDAPSHLRNKLLSADELFNDYSYPLNYYGCSLKIMDICGYNNKEIIKELWEKALEGDTRQILTEIRCENTCKDLESIGDALLSRTNINVTDLLLDYGFTKEAIMEYYSHRAVDGLCHPNFKKRVLEEMKKIGPSDEMYLKAKKRCEAWYGIN
ncbi:Nuclear pore complex protein [Astathelohania contejeani]|uniref:Nuclear pore complex protein n=1 Tax=Astathelohania contejeani TaxID=164912 RepID=A0ABQ7HYY5_9MICR|nr:Nuclear pore complex protein [Thelohania contejeani]